MSEKMLLIKFHNNYADEFDVDGFFVWPQSKWEEHKTLATKYFEKVAKAAPPEENAYRRSRGGEVEVYFGTNEQIIFSGIKDYLDSFKTTELTESEAKVLSKHFKGWRNHARFGKVLMLEDQLSEMGEFDV